MAQEDLNSLGFSPDTKVIIGKDIDKPGKYMIMVVYQTSTSY